MDGPGLSSLNGQYFSHSFSACSIVEWVLLISILHVVAFKLFVRVLLVRFIPGQWLLAHIHLRKQSAELLFFVDQLLFLDIGFILSSSVIILLGRLFLDSIFAEVDVGQLGRVV